MIDRYDTASICVRLFSLVGFIVFVSLFIDELVDPGLTTIGLGGITAIFLVMTTFYSTNPQSLSRRITGRIKRSLLPSGKPSHDMRPFVRNIVANLERMLPSADILLEGNPKYIEDCEGRGRFRPAFNERKQIPEKRSSITVKWSNPHGRSYSEQEYETPRQPFSTIIAMGENSICIEHALWDKSPVTVRISTSEGPISEVLKASEAQNFFERLEEIQIRAFSDMLDCPCDLESISTMVALRLEKGFDHVGSQKIGDAELTYVHFNPANRSPDQRSQQSWLHHPSVGVMRLSIETIKTTLVRKRDHQLLAAFDRRIDPVEKMPPMIGNPSAAKEISIAQNLVKRYPDMKDDSGTLITPLVNEHLPRLVRRHADAIAAATASRNIDQDLLNRISRDFDEGLKTISRAILEGIEAEQRRTQDDLSVEIAFLKARHPKETDLRPAG